MSDFMYVADCYYLEITSKQLKMERDNEFAKRLNIPSKEHIEAIINLYGYNLDDYKVRRFSNFVGPPSDSVHYGRFKGEGSVLNGLGIVKEVEVSDSRIFTTPQGHKFSREEFLQYCKDNEIGTYKTGVQVRRGDTSIMRWVLYEEVLTEDRLLIKQGTYGAGDGLFEIFPISKGKDIERMFDVSDSVIGYLNLKDCLDIARAADEDPTEYERLILAHF